MDDEKQDLNWWKKEACRNYHASEFWRLEAKFWKVWFYIGTTVIALCWIGTLVAFIREGTSRESQKEKIEQQAPNQTGGDRTQGLE